MALTGELFIGRRRASTAQRFQAVDPARDETLETAFSAAGPAELEAACALAQAAFDPYRNLPPVRRADFLEAIARQILALGEPLLERAHRETALPLARLTGERGRTVAQLRLFAEELRGGEWLGLRVDPALPQRTPAPRPDLRQRKIACGPVAVFGASNFPLAFSVAGGDSAAALAAGCPIVVKGHPAHPGTSEWVAQAIVLSPWAAYCYTGERRILATGYPAMCRYAAYLATRAQGDLLDYGLGDWFDWGPKPPGESQLTSQRLTASATYCRLLATLAAIARVLGHPADANRFARRAVTVRRALNRALFDPSRNAYGRDSQTANAMPLAIGLVPARHRRAVLANLVADIRAHGNHVTAGDIGYLYVILSLMQGGRADVLFDILTQTTAPSYGYQLARGATALTETWNANPDNSQNHFMLGQAEAWLYGGLAGLRIDLHRAAHERIRIEPQPVKGVRYAAVRYQAVFGEVSVRWVKNVGETRLRLRVSVPAGMLATIAVPCPEPDRIREGRRALRDAYGVLHARRSAGRTLITAGSGRYVFDVPLG